jgi:hypothetical protein
MSSGSVQLQLTNVQSHIGYDNLANILEGNMKMYYDWALLSIGGWSEVTIPTSGSYGGDYSELRLVQDPNYNLGQVWEAPRKDFVWESNIDYTDTTGGVRDPATVGIPTVDGVPTAQSYYVNYPEGKVVFDVAIPSTSEVNLEYSYRYVQIYRADDAPWWRELQFNSHRIDSSQFQQLGTGIWSLFSEHRVQLPAIVIETIPRGVSRAWELGSNSKIASRDMLFHIYTESHSERNNLMDIFNLQNDRKIPLFNTNDVASNDHFPLDYRGELVNNVGFEEYVSLTGYKWRNCLMQNSTITNVIQVHPQLYSAVVRTTMEIIV